MYLLVDRVNIIDSSVVVVQSQCGVWSGGGACPAHWAACSCRYLLRVLQNAARMEICKYLSDEGSDGVKWGGGCGLFGKSSESSGYDHAMDSNR